MRAEPDNKHWSPARHRWGPVGSGSRVGAWRLLAPCLPTGLPGALGQQNGLPTFPLCTRQPLLMSGCLHCSITPSEPSAPQHLWGDPGGSRLLGQRYCRRLRFWVSPAWRVGSSGGFPRIVTNLALYFVKNVVSDKEIEVPHSPHYIIVVLGSNQLCGCVYSYVCV